MIRVFISHSSKDKELVKSLIRLLESFLKGIVEFYLAIQDPQPGRNLSDKVKKEIDKSDIVLVLLTPNSKISTYVNQEIGYSVACEKDVIPLVTPNIPRDALGMLEGKECIVLSSEGIPRLVETLTHTTMRIMKKKHLKQAVDSFTFGIAVGFIIFALLSAFTSEQ